MKKMMLTVICASFVVGAPIAGFADSANWSDAKAAKVDANRNSNAGIGNGGERNPRGRGWIPTIYGEDGPQDIDPGNSQDHNQACTGDDFRQTSC